ncbi:Killer protein [Burkholderia ubonensis]|uniref:Killer protein n=1 Tax=Burkholderia ubonensis TaxID=101571 RepID=A0A108CH94_9BURK|nr:type II toxin-antitoxin system RelE/ParE family toxin [Burkholderia ubonensis]KWK74479.1 Killer protein [Burkholderia ubonensis]
MIKSWQHKGLEAFFLSGSKAGIRPDHAPRLGRQLARLDLASAPLDMNVPGWRFHRLEGALVGHYAVSVNGNWRLTFRFDGPDAVLVDY